MLPKVEGANELSNFRPIVVANFVDKNIPNILADRLGTMASRILSPSRFVFIRGWSIYHLIGMISKCFNLLDSRCVDGNVGIKFNIAKALDTLD